MRATLILTILSFLLLSFTNDEGSKKNEVTYPFSMPHFFSIDYDSLKSNFIYIKKDGVQLDVAKTNYGVEISLSGNNTYLSAEFNNNNIVDNKINGKVDLIFFKENLVICNIIFPVNNPIIIDEIIKKYGNPNKVLIDSRTMIWNLKNTSVVIGPGKDGIGSVVSIIRETENQLN